MTSTAKLTVGAAIAAGCAVWALAAPAQAAPSAPCSTVARACVDLSTHQAWLMRGGVVTYGPVPALPGSASAPTDPGTFRVTFKDLHHRSTIFNNAPMPYSVFFNGGDAFHEGSLSVYSHGCVHLSHSAAVQFYDSLKPGDVVQVVP